jgi:hydroxymethylpyrimidine pyrophosphatase-like HAD family hydrolase
LPPAAVERIAALLRAEGMTSKVSSIHVNGWFGAHDKLTMTRTLLHEAFDIDLDAECSRFVFVGDSPNDAPMFEFFPNSIGVANVQRFTGRLLVPPKYVTEQEFGAGFAEVANFLLAGR